MRGLRAKLLLACAGLAVVPLSSVPAAAVEYLRVCSLYGAGYIYIPGTATCLNTVTGETRQQTSEGTFRVLNRIDLAFEGMAVAAAMPTAVLQGDKTFAAAISGGFYDGAGAGGIAAAVGISDNVSVSGGISLTPEQNLVGSNIGFNLTW